MSSSEAGNHNSPKPPVAKRRRVPRVGLACDRCRKRKMKCDGRIGGKKCQPCAENGFACEYIHAMQKYQVGYVKALENKVDRLQRVLRRLHPDADFTEEVGAPLTEDNWAQEAFLVDSTPEPDLRVPSVFVSAGASPSIASKAKAGEVIDIDENDQASKLCELTDEFKNLTLGTYHGPFSSVGLVHSALNLTFELTGARLSLDDLSRFGRPQFWRFNSWEYMPEQHNLDFPPPDLLQALVNLYFDHLNPYMPVLHRPTFTRKLSAGLHNVDLSFGFLVLNVCANGARHSKDPRVTMPGAEAQSAGWHWFNQSICLSTMYLMGCSAMQSSWVWCRHGISLAQDVGAHKKGAYGSIPNAEDEQFKRAFWVLVLLDRNLSVTMGRPYATKDDEFDLDYPIACDDEYWDHPDPARAFKQPEGVPSRIDFLLSVIELTTSVGPGMHVVFAGAKGRASLGTPAEGWERETIADLDSRHNVWADTVPAHISWDTEGKDEIFFLQAAHLWIWSYDGAIILHRPFITPRPNCTPPHVEHDLGLPFLSICLRAARAIVCVIETVQDRFPGQLFPLLQKPVYEAGMMLFLGIWGSKNFGIASRVEEDLRGIHICMQFLETLETRIHPAGRHRDVMNALLSLVELPTPTLARGQKRSLDETEDLLADQAQDVPLHSDVLASLDDWFAGAQFDTAQSSLQLPSVNGPAAANMDNQWDAIFQASDFSALGASDTFGAAPVDVQSPWTAFAGGHAIPLDSWGIPADGPSTFYDPLSQLSGSSQGTRNYQNTHAFNPS